MNGARIRQTAGMVIAAGIVAVCAGPCPAVRDNPYIITGYETSRYKFITPEEIAENYRIVMNSDEELEPVTVGGLACVLQSPRNKYWPNDDIFLCLRLFPDGTMSRVPVDTRGRVHLRIVSKDSGKEVANASYCEADRPLQRGETAKHPQAVEIVKDAVYPEWTGVDFVLTRHDFRVAGLKKGAYRIFVSYASSQGGWVGEITAPPVDIVVLD
jgi:hypothetical protein